MITAHAVSETRARFARSSAASKHVSSVQLSAQTKAAPRATSPKHARVVNVSLACCVHFPRCALPDMLSLSVEPRAHQLPPPLSSLRRRQSAILAQLRRTRYPFDQLYSTGSRPNLAAHSSIEILPPWHSFVTASTASSTMAEYSSVRSNS